MILEQTEVTKTHTLDDRLMLRFARLDDIEPLAQFNGRIHGDGKFNPFVAQWTREFASPSHPTCGPSNVTLVEDTHSGQIVSSTCLIPQTWTYDGIAFEVGRPEAVGTDPAYRRRGLIRKQFEVLHAKSEAARHLAQGITGIPWYYRQFGYEYAIELGGGRCVYPALIPALKTGEAEAYHLRPMTPEDIPLAMELYDQECARSLVACLRPAAEWQRMLKLVFYRTLYIVETSAGRPVGMISVSRELTWGGLLPVRSFNVIEGQSIRALLPAALRLLMPVASAEAAAQQQELTALFFELGAQHPAFDAAPELFQKIRPPYAWYVRVADMTKFLQRVTPVLEARLAQSALAGYSGAIKVTEYVRGFKLSIERGKIFAEAWQPDDTHNAMFPPDTFLQLLFGRRSLSELRGMYPDCLMEDEAAALLEALFPRRHSNVSPMG